MILVCPFSKLKLTRSCRACASFFGHCMLLLTRSSARVLCTATGHFVQPHVAAHCGGDIYSRRKPLFSSFGEHTAVCGSSVRQAVARPRHRQSVCIHNMHVAATCRPSVLGSATMRGHMWFNKVASVLGPLCNARCTAASMHLKIRVVVLIYLLAPSIWQSNGTTEREQLYILNIFLRQCSIAMLMQWWS